MKFTIERAPMLKMLGHMHRIVERRNTIPILLNVLIRAEGENLWLKSTDLDLQAEGQLAADVKQQGTLTVPAHMLHDIVKKLPEGSQLSGEATDKSLVIKSGRSRFTLQTLPDTDFPALSAENLTHHFDMPTANLKLLIDKTSFALSNEETRYYLNGVYMHTPDYALRGVSTDGHRLSRIDVDLPDGAAGMAGIIIPKKTVAEIAKLCADISGQVSISVGATKIRLAFGSLTLTSKLIDGTFPDYNRVIPARNPHKATLGLAEFRSAIDRVSAVTSERGNRVKCSFVPGKLTLSVENPDGGSAVEEIEADYSGPVLETAYNARYLLDILTVLDSDTCAINLAEAGSPALIASRDGARHVIVLMPVRV